MSIRQTNTKQKITPFLWFDDKAEEAVNFYVSIFSASGGKKSSGSPQGGTKVMSTSRYDEDGAKAAGRPAGSVMTVAFKLDGQDFTAINGGPIFKFTEAISFAVNCKDQQEVDYFWDSLSAAGEPGQCGWLKDKYGLSWQIVPAILGELMSGTDPEKARRVMQAMLAMKKIDIEALERAHAG
jgi:predicted 3-demethylubiquinone-9 3-methyltransferase (glyoxalase superfamily)